MKKISKYKILIAVLFTSLALVSCDFLLPAPLGRTNPEDNEAQISRFIGFVSGTDSIVTSWNWQKALSVIADDRVIDKIRIVHGEGDPPVTMDPLDSSTVIEYTDPSEWSFNWIGLNTDRDQFFSLYAHETGGQWLSPRTLELSLGNSVKDNYFTFYSSDGFSPYNNDEFKVFKVQETPFGVLEVSNSSAPGFLAGDIIIISFNINESVYFDQFTLYLNNISPPVTDTELNIYVIKDNLDTGFTWADLVSENTLDYDFFITRPFTVAGGAYQSIDIAEIANRMFLYYSGGIAIKLSDPLDVDVSAWSVDTHYWVEGY